MAENQSSIELEKSGGGGVLEVPIYKPDSPAPAIPVLQSTLEKKLERVWGDHERLGT